MKLRVYISQLWNVLDTVGIALFIIGMVLRFVPATLRDAELIYCMDITLWQIRILEILSVNKYLGPYVKIMGKLLRDMCYFLLILFIAVTSFGIIRQTINYQNKEVSWHMRLRNVWYYPYWNIYGELFAEEIDPCDIASNNTEGHCSVYASWIGPFSMFIYLLVANILMVNLLIARFNATFLRNNANSKEIWMFQRYDLILQYEMRPVLPPPFIFITHVYLSLKYIKRRCKGKRDFYDNGLKLFLSHEDTEKLHDFEEECMEDLYREKDMKHHNSMAEQIRVISERVENMSVRLDDMSMKENHMRLTLGALDHHMGHIDDLEESLYEAIKIIKLMANKEGGDIDDSQDDLTSVNHPRTYSSGSSVEVGVHHARTVSVASSDAVDRTQASPLLVHSTRKTKGEQLKRFTSTTRQRRLSGSDFPTEDMDQFVGEGSNGPASSTADASVQFAICKYEPNNRGHAGNVDIAPVLDVSPGNVEVKDQDVTSSKNESSSQRRRMRNFAVQSIHFVESAVDSIDDSDNFHELPTQPLTDVTARLDTNTQTVSQLPEYAVSDSESTDLGLTPEDLEPYTYPEPPILNVSMPTNIFTGNRLSKMRSSFAGQPLSLNTMLAVPSFTPCSMPQSSACFTVPDPETLPPAAARDLSSMFNPMMGEYTSITDAIDTSCIGELSPPCSPGGTSASLFSDSKSRVKERSAASSKQMELKHAEEMEHQKLETLIHHRLRQISQPDWLKLMGQKWQHQRYSSSGNGRAGCGMQETGHAGGGGPRGSIWGDRGGGGSKSGGAIQSRGPKEKQCNSGRHSNCQKCQTTERNRRRSYGGNPVAFQRSSANQNLTAKSRHRRHSVTLTVPVLDNGAVRRHSVTLPMAPVIHSFCCDHMSASRQLDINIHVVGVEEKVVEVNLDTPVKDGEMNKSVDLAGSNIDITVTPPSV